MPIEVFCRVKDGDISHNTTENSCCINFTYNKKPFKYTINKLWDQYSNNINISYDLLKRADVYNNSYIVAFGYTGSGKTYTTSGILKELLYFYSMQKLECNVTAIQIYNENIYDLLNENKKLKFFKTDRLVVDGVKAVILSNIESLLSTIDKNRSTASTSMNNFSSRSHAIVTLTAGNKTHVIVDMAGQESSSTGNKADAVIRSQGTHINLNMLALKECIRCYHEKNAHIPFRRSILTLALKPMFYKKCHVSFICTLSANHSTYYKMDSLRYASALFKPLKNKDKIYFNLFNDYTKYVQQTGLTGCEERSLWKEMKEGNFKNIKKIESYCKNNQKMITQLKKELNEYKNKLPELK